MARRDPRETYHDRVASRYEGVYDTPYWRFYREISWRHLKRFLPSTRPAWALDLGCGPGWFGVRLLKAGFHVTFLDISGAMLDEARARVDRLGRPEKAEFVKADMQDLGSLERGRYAFATAQGDTLGFCSHPPSALAGLADVMAPGGTVVLSVDHRAAAAQAYVARRDLAGLARFLKTGRTEWLASRKGERFPVHMFEPGELRTLLEGAGFQVLDLVGKTVLFHREDKLLLGEAPLKRLVALEEKVQGREGWLGLASHLQVAARKEISPGIPTDGSGSGFHG